MSARPEPVVGPAACPICGVVAAVVDERCANCDCDLAGTGGRPLYSKVALAWTIAAFAVVYVVVVLVVAISN
jgi:hypothetical protein